jgi:hypothetical protein
MTIISTDLWQIWRRIGSKRPSPSNDYSPRATKAVRTSYAPQGLGLDGNRSSTEPVEDDDVFEDISAYYEAKGTDPSAPMQLD